MKISEAKPNSNATLEAVEVVSKGEVRQFAKFGKDGRVCTCTIKDGSGEMQMTLWNDEVESVDVGDKLKITDGWVKEWNGNMQISAGRSGKVEKL